MEKPRTQAEARKERFDKQARIAKDLADLAMAEIDEALEEQTTLRRLWFGPEDGIPIADCDTLAPPIGYYQPPESIID